jgi:hypothetical protein
MMFELKSSYYCLTGGWTLDLLSPFFFLLGPFTRAKFFPTGHQTQMGCCLIFIHIYQFGPLRSAHTQPKFVFDWVIPIYFLFLQHYILINFHSQTNYGLANIIQLFHNFLECPTIFLAFSFVPSYILIFRELVRFVPWSFVQFPK